MRGPFRQVIGWDLVFFFWGGFWGLRFLGFGSGFRFFVLGSGFTGTYVSYVGVCQEM